MIGFESRPSILCGIKESKDLDKEELWAKAMRGLRIASRSESIRPTLVEVQRSPKSIR